ncbi:hypothetical protein HK405_010252, partial [Cladochytrium tenue]
DGYFVDPVAKDYAALAAATDLTVDGVQVLELPSPEPALSGASSLLPNDPANPFAGTATTPAAFSGSPAARVSRGPLATVAASASPFTFTRPATSAEYFYTPQTHLAGRAGSIDTPAGAVGFASPCPGGVPGSGLRSRRGEGTGSGKTNADEQSILGTRAPWDDDASVYEDACADDNGGDGAPESRSLAPRVVTWLDDHEVLPQPEVADGVTSPHEIGAEVDAATASALLDCEEPPRSFLHVESNEPSEGGDDGGDDASTGTVLGGLNLSHTEPTVIESEVADVSNLLTGLSDVDPAAASGLDAPSLGALDGVIDEDKLTALPQQHQQQRNASFIGSLGGVIDDDKLEAEMTSGANAMRQILPELSGEIDGAVLAPAAEAGETDMPFANEAAVVAAGDVGDDNDSSVDLNELDPFNVSVVVQQQLSAGGAAAEINEVFDGGDVDDTDALHVLDGADVAPPAEYDMSGLEAGADADASAHLSTASVQANVSSATFMLLLPGDASGVFTGGDDNEEAEVSEDGHSIPGPLGTFDASDMTAAAVAAAAATGGELFTDGDSFAVEPSMAALNGVSGLFAHPPELPPAARADSPPPPAMQLHELPALEEEEEEDDDDDGDVLEATDVPCVSVVLDASVADFAGPVASVASVASATTSVTWPAVAGAAEVGWSVGMLPPPPPLPGTQAAFAFTEAASPTAEEARTIAHERLAGLRRVLAARVDGGCGVAVRPGENADAARDRAFVEAHRSLKDLRAFVADAALRASRQRLVSEAVQRQKEQLQERIGGVRREIGMMSTALQKQRQEEELRRQQQSLLSKTQAAALEKSGSAEDLAAGGAEDDASPKVEGVSGAAASPPGKKIKASSWLGLLRTATVVLLSAVAIFWVVLPWSDA